MTNLAHDWEFYEDGKTIRPISVGIVSETGDEYYAVFSDAGYWSHKTQWLVDNVYPNLATDLIHHTDFVKSRETIVRELCEFIWSFDKPELWAWYGAYDHVVMAQTIGGRMIDLPSGIPMYTNDIKTLQWMFWGDKPLSVENPHPHHALWDARYDMQLLKVFKKGNF